MAKNSYTSPSVAKLGEVSDVTKANQTFSQSDGVEVAGTNGQLGGVLS